MRSNLLIALAPLVLVACDVEASDRVVVVGPDAGAAASDPAPADPPPTTTRTPLFWDSACLNNPAATQIQLGDVNKPKFIQYTWGGTYTTTQTSLLYGINTYAYDPGCIDGFLVDVLGTNQQFGVVVNYQDALPTNKDACSQTSIWVSGYTYGAYVGAYSDYLNFATRWNRYDAYGKPLPIAQQSPQTGNKYALSDSRYAVWANGKCTIAPLELTFRHPDWPYGAYYPWYRLVIGGFRGTSATTYADKATIQVRIGLDSAVPGCKASYFCNSDFPSGPDDDPPPDSTFTTYGKMSCADGAKNVGIVNVGGCTPPPQNSDITVSTAIGLGLLILGIIFG